MKSISPLKQVVCAGFVMSLALCSTGCSMLKIPSLSTLSGMSPPPVPEMTAPTSPPLGADQGTFPGALPGAGAPSSAMESVYYATRQAKAQGGIVLHVQGADPPVRVLPLPDDGRTVYVSQLISQSGVDEKLGRFDATLFRHSPMTIGGLRMDCKMSSDGKQIRAECDYALKPGDRVRVRKASGGGLGGLVDLVLAR